MDRDELSLKLNSTNQLCQNFNVSYCNLVELGMKLPPHVINRLPNDYIVIECINTEFFAAIQHLNKQDIIGLSLEGCDIGRAGTLEWINISSSTCIYLFNIKSLEKDAFEKGLKMLLENKRIVKVFHDCRRASDCFHHQYNTKPLNVYDTQVADFLVNAIKKDVELITNKVTSLNSCLQVYLNITKEYLCEKFKTAVTFSFLPLNNDLLQFFVKNVIYLRLLKQELDMILRMPFRRCVDVYLQAILRKPDHELKLCRPALDLVPTELVRENMQVFQFTEKLKPQVSSTPESKDNPMLRYERDCRKYQQEYGYGKYANNKEFEDGFNHENVNGNWSYSNRTEIIQFLLDRMFECDSCDRSVISMTPFENLTEQDDCSVASEKDLCENSDTSDHSFTKSRIKLKSKNFHSFEDKLSFSSKSLHNQIDAPFENPSTSDESCTSTVNVMAPAVDINLSNDSTLPYAKISAKSVNSDSALSDESQASNKQKQLLSGQKQFSSGSSYSSKDSMSGINLFSAKGNFDGVKISVSPKLSDSTLSKKSHIYKLFAEQKSLLAKQNPSTCKSSSSIKDSESNVYLSSTKKNLNGVPESVGVKSSDTSLSGKSLIYQMFVEQKCLLTSEKIGPKEAEIFDKELVRDANFSSVGKSSNDDKRTVTDPISLNASNTSSSSLSHKLKKLLESNRHAKKLCSSDTGSSASSMLPLSLPRHNESMNEQYLKDYNATDSDDINNKDDSSVCAVTQVEDPWAKLRDAFSELGPTTYSSKNVKFIPAGMQY